MESIKLTYSCTVCPRNEKGVKFRRPNLNRCDAKARYSRFFDDFLVIRMTTVQCRWEISVDVSHALGGEGTAHSFNAADRSLFVHLKSGNQVRGRDGGKDG